MSPWELALLAWGVALFSWEAWNALSLAECLLPQPDLLPACLLLLLVGGIAHVSWEPVLLVAWEVVLLGGWSPTCLGDLIIHLENSTVCLGSLGSPRPGWVPNCLGWSPACLGDLSIHLGNTTICLGSPKLGWVPNCLGRSWPVTCLRPSITWVREDLMKSTEVDESLATTTTTVQFQRKPTCFKIYSTEWEIYTKNLYL